jgi:hypothetical protein
MWCVEDSINAGIRLASSAQFQVSQTRAGTSAAVIAPRCHLFSPPNAAPEPHSPSLEEWGMGGSPPGGPTAPLYPDLLPLKAGR